MKKGLIKIIGTSLLAGALTLFPAKKVNGLENLIDGMGVVRGNVIETITETPVKVELKAWEYLGNGVIGDFLGKTSTNDNGEYSLGIDSSSNLVRFEISNPDSSVYQGVRYFDLNESNFNFDVIKRHDVDVWNPNDGGKIEKMDFMKIFDMWCRDPSLGGCTQRWENQPRWYIWTDLANQEQVTMAEDIIKNDLVQFTNGFIKNPIIEKNKNPPNLNDLNGKIVVMWDKDPGFYHSEKIENNKIYSGFITLSTYFLERRPYLEELTQVLGPRTGTETRYFWDLETGQYLPVAKDIGNILYKRPIGNKTPDINPAPNVEIRRYVRPATNLTVKDVPDDNGNQLELNWNPSISEGKGLVSKYRIYRSRDSNLGNAVLIDSVNAGNNKFVDENVPLNNTPYYYWIETVGNANNYAAEKAANNGISKYIEAPLNLRVGDVPNDQGHQLWLKWDKSPSENEGIVDVYRIFRSRNSSGIKNVRNINDFSRFGSAFVDSVNAWEQNYAVLRDSTNAGVTEYIDRFVPIDNVPYYYWVNAVGYGGEIGSNKIAGNYDGIPISVEEKINEFYVRNPYPNPFNSNVNINYNIPERSNISINVYDILGRRIKTLENSNREAGSYNALWDGRDENGRNVSNGVYLYQINAGKYKNIGKMMLVK